LPGAFASEARFSPEGTRLLVAAGTNVHVLHAADGRAALAPLPHRGAVVGIRWAPDGASFYTATPVDGVQSWDAASGRRLAEFPDSGRVTAFAVNADGSKLATGHEDRTVRLWDAASQRPLFPAWPAPGDVRKLAFPGAGRALAFAGSSSTGSSELHLREATTGQALTTIRHRNELNDFDFSADGRRVVTGGEDRSARVWDATTGAVVSPLLIHQFALQHVNLSPDGRRLVTLGTRGFVRLWTAGGEPLTPFYDLTRDEGSYHAQFSPDSRRLLFTTGAKSAWMLDLTPDPAPLSELQVRARALAAAQLDPAGGLAPLENAELDAVWRELLATRARRSTP
jgi:WD40 repeat protein